MLTVISLGGDCIKSSELINIVKDSDLLIAADGGAKHFEMLSIIPDILVGDMDSIPKDLIVKYQNKHTIIKTFDRKKDYTDSEIAVQEALKANSNTIVFIGAFGNRLDHMFANQMMAISLAEKNVNVIMTDGVTSFYTITEDSPLKYFVNYNNAKEDIFSLIIGKGDESNVTIEGLEYRLDNETVRFGENRCVSNVLPFKPSSDSNHEIEIKISNGVAFFVHTKSN